MTEDPLIHARKRAEHAVKSMNEGPLKIAAFQAILTKLLGDSEHAEEGQRTSAKAPSSPVKHPDSLRGRVLTIKSEGFFKMQRSLGEVREARHLSFLRQEAQETHHKVAGIARDFPGRLPRALSGAG